MRGCISYKFVGGGKAILRTLCGSHTSAAIWLACPRACMAPVPVVWLIMSSMDLNLDLADLRVRGRVKQRLVVEDSGPLCEADLALLASEKGVKAPALVRLSDRHHALARDIASGMSHSVAGIKNGYTASRVSILIGDPAFLELVAHYRAIPDAHYADVHERLAGMTVDAIEVLRSRLEDEPGEISTGQLVEITKLGADRTGNGPASSSMNIHVHAGLAEKLEAARKRVQKMRDITPKEIEDGD